MKYSILAKTYEELEKESGKLKKVDILSNLLSKTPTGLLPKVVVLASGKVFPAYSELKTGVATKMMMKAISKSTGISQNEIVKKFKNFGDLGLVAGDCVKSKKQKVFFKKTLTVQMAFNNIRKLATITGAGSQEKKLNLIAELLVSSEPVEARYIVRTILETMRIGVAEGIIRDSIAKTFNVNAEAVENAWFLKADYGEIAKITKNKGEAGLKKVRIELGKPIVIMLGEKSPTLKKALEEYRHSILEYKYDGMRVQIHKKSDKFWIFTRRLENVTDQFPDLLKFAKDRHRYLQWLYKSRKRYGLTILNYMVTSNHIHLLVVDTGDRDVIPNSMQLVAGRTGQEYNQRKDRKGHGQRYNQSLLDERENFRELWSWPGQYSLLYSFDRLQMHFLHTR